MASRRSSSPSPRPRSRKPKAESVTVDAAQASLPSQVEAPAQAPAIPEVASLLTELSGPSVLDGQLYFTRADLHFYERRQLEAQSALKDIQLHKLAIEKAKSDFEKAKLDFDERVRHMTHQLAQVTANAKAKETALHHLQSAIERKYAVNLRHVLYDNDTGRISVQS